MKRLLTLIILMLSISVHSEESFTYQLVGYCYIAEFKFEDSQDINVNTICINDKDVISRMTFTNIGSLPSVCYQRGTVELHTQKSIKMTLVDGICDNGRPFESDILSCTETDNNIYGCKSPHGTMNLKYVGHVK